MGQNYAYELQQYMGQNFRFSTESDHISVSLITMYQETKLIVLSACHMSEKLCEYCLSVCRSLKELWLRTSKVIYLLNWMVLKV